MTINPGVLEESCSRLSNICLQLLSNLKQLERINQVYNSTYLRQENFNTKNAENLHSLTYELF